MTPFEELVARQELEDKKARRKVYSLIGLTLFFFVAYSVSFYILKRPIIWLPIGFFASAALTGFVISGDFSRLTRNNKELMDAVNDEITKAFQRVGNGHITRTIELYGDPSNPEIRNTSNTQCETR